MVHNLQIYLTQLGKYSRIMILEGGTLDLAFIFINTYAHVDRCLMNTKAPTHTHTHAMLTTIGIYVYLRRFTITNYTKLMFIL